MNIVNHEFKTSDQIATETGFTIEALGDALRQFQDTNSKHYACEAAKEGRGSFWARTSYGNTASSLFVDHANLIGDLETAIALAKLPRVKVSNFRFHDTRHTAATRILRVSNLRVAQKLLGHEDIKTTTKYAHAMVEDIRNGLDAMSPTESALPENPTRKSKG